MVASTRRGLSDCARSNTRGPNGGIQSRIVRHRSHPRGLGLLTVDDNCRSSLSSSSLTEDQKLLSELIRHLVFDQDEHLSSMLVKRFGSLAHLLATGPDDYHDLAIPKSVQNLLDCMRFAISRVLKAEIVDRPIFASHKAVVSYLYSMMANLPREMVRVLFLDSGNRLLDDRVMWEGSVSKVQIHVSEIIRVALRCDAAAIIVAHNHPSGDPRPSSGDIAITRKLVTAAESVDLRLHDHLIVASQGWCSLRKEGFIEGDDLFVSSMGERTNAE
jgi:DNA repair protein RadC